MSMLKPVSPKSISDQFAISSFTLGHLSPVPGESDWQVPMLLLSVLRPFVTYLPT